MSLGAPAAFFGEFDAQDGPKVNFAFEYFHYFQDTHVSGPPPSLRLIGGTGFVARGVAGGRLHPDYVEFTREVAARVLTSNEAHEESVLFQDPGCPAVGSFTFCLPDILARGEKRRFCLIFVHQEYGTLVSHWPLISATMRIAIDRWTRQTTARYHTEYRTFPDLERRREEARRKPLRLVTTLLSSCKASSELADGEVDDGDVPEPVQLSAIQRMVCFFDAAFPLIFASPMWRESPSVAAREKSKEPLSGVSTNGGTSSLLDGVLEARLEADMVLADMAARQVDFEDPECVVQLPSFQGSDLAVCPLVVWLREMVADGATAKSWCAMEAMLHALFTGNQILVIPAHPDDVDDAANLALSLALTLPPPLCTARLYRDEYVMPYAARIASMSARFLTTYEVMPFQPSRGASAVATVSANGGAEHQRKPFVLSAIEAEGVIAVTVSRGRIAQITECDRLISAVAWQQSSEADGGGGASGGCADKVSPPPMPQPAHPATSTLSQRVVLLVQDHVQGEHGPAGAAEDRRALLLPAHVTAIRLLHAQVAQLVREYVLRGRVYKTLYLAQEVGNNHEVLHGGGVCSEAAGTRLPAPPAPCVSQGSGHQPHRAHLPPPSARGSSPGSLWSWLRGRAGHSGATTRASAAQSHRGNSPPPVLSVSSNTTSVRREGSLSVDETNRLFAQERFVFTSSTPGDHPVLMFLGGAAS